MGRVLSEVSGPAIFCAAISSVALHHWNLWFERTSLTLPKIKPMKALRVLSFSILALTFLSCDKSSTGPENGDPPRTFWINFIISDSAGNNLLPYNLPENPIVDPNSFHASSDWNDSIGRYLRHPEHGFIFQMAAKYYDFMYNPDFQQDSTFNMYPCFGGLCDTVTIYHRFW